MTFLNRHRSRIRPVGPFSPSSLFLGGIPGAWYDPTDLSTMFQDSTGTTPVTAVEQPVGLILDKSQGLSFSNGTRAINLLPAYSQDVSQSDWSKTQVVTPNATTITDTAVNNFHFLQSQTISVTAGVSHTLRLRLQAGTLGFGGAHFFDGTARGCSINLTTGALGTPYGGASASAVADGAGWILTITCTPTANGVVAIYCSNTNALVSYLGSGQSITATNIDFRRTADVGVTPSPYQLITSGWAATNPGNHASQSTAASRPTYRARYNLVEQSEVFSNAYWTKSSTTISADAGTAPDGTVTADLAYPTTTGTARIVWRNLVPGINGQRYTVSVYAKASGKSILYFGTLQGNTAPDADLPFFNLTTGQVAQAGAYFDTVTIQSVGSGWYRCTATKNAVTSANLYPIFGVADASGNTTATTNGTDGIFIWGAQLLTAADVTATGNAYQRIAAATVYDTAPIFRPYLAFDGLDDSLSTAAINLTSTSKATVFVGQTKNSDAAGSVILGHGVDFSAVGAWEYQGNTAANATTAFRGRSTAGSAAQAGYTRDVTSPATFVFVSIVDYTAAAGAEFAGRYNTIAQAQNVGVTEENTGTFGNNVLTIGARQGGASLRFNGRLYSVILRGAASSVTEIADTELWVNARTGGY